jgi:glucose/arabinose dehydrogenase
MRHAVWMELVRPLSGSALAVAALMVVSSFAQAQTPAPSWAQGRPPDRESSPLKPHAPRPTPTPGKEIPLSKVKLPPGFKIELWAEGVANARSLALGSKGTVFVGTRQRGDVYAVVDRGGSREVKTIAKGLNTPNGVAFKNGTLYVAEINRILRYDGIENRLDNPPEPKVLTDALPKDLPHGWKFLAVGPDGWLYFNIGAPCNICVPAYTHANISRIHPESGVLETYAMGVRNSVGMDWHPLTKELWFTEHQRDWLSDDTPQDKLNRAPRQGMNFGFPFCHQGDILDPELGKGRRCGEFTKPALKLGPHTAPDGMRFYTGSMFPPEYRNNIFVALHGSWNRAQKTGFNVTRVSIGANGEPKAEVFLSGILEGENFWGRPVDVLVMRDGSLLVSDDWNGAIYRISYSK